MDGEPDGATRLFKPRDTWRILPSLFEPWITTEGKDYWVSLGKSATFHAEPDETGQPVRTYLDAGESGPRGAVVVYVLDEESAGSSVALEFVDDEGRIVRRIEPKPAGRDEMSDDEKAMHSGPWITTKTGVNRFVWDLRHEGATKVLGNKLGGQANQGPMVVPGTYRARLVITKASGETETWEESFSVKNDPRVEVPQEHLEEQLEALLGIRDHISRAHTAVTTIRSIKRQLAQWRERSDLEEEGHRAADALEAQLHEIEDTLMVPGEHKDVFGLNQPARLSEKLSSVIPIIASADAMPTRNSLQVAAKYSAEIDEQLARLRRGPRERARRLQRLDGRRPTCPRFGAELRRLRRMIE